MVEFTAHLQKQGHYSELYRSVSVACLYRSGLTGCTPGHLTRRPLFEPFFEDFAGYRAGLSCEAEVFRDTRNRSSSFFYQ